MVAIKNNEADKQPLTMLTNEVTIMKRIRHENVVSCFEAIYMEAVKIFWLVMQYVKGCSLARILEVTSFIEGQICFTAKQCIKVLNCYTMKVLFIGTSRVTTLLSMFTTMSRSQTSAPVTYLPRIKRRPTLLDYFAGWPRK